MTLDFAVRLPWLALAAVWAITALAAKPTVRTEAPDTRIGHMVTVAVAFALLFHPGAAIGPLAWDLFPPSPLAAAVGVALTLAGTLFAIWARLSLGGNWSATVTIKQRHTLIRTGPYSTVRHPIYTGMLFAMLGVAIATAELRGFLAVVLAFAAWSAKARLEESFLLAQFGDAYRAYRRQVRALIPFVL